jgi:hypothetical protein
MEDATRRKYDPEFKKTFTDRYCTWKKVILCIVILNLFI